MAEEDPDEEGAHAGTLGASILLVEDEELLRSLIERVLERSGYRVLAAPEGLQALELLGQHRFDLLVTDLELPDIDGRELARRARALQPALRVLVVSGRCNDPVLRAELAARDQHAVEKPFSNQSLLDGVRRALGSTAPD